MPKIVANKLLCGVDCTLKAECGHKPINIEGNPATAKILFVGEAPGEFEAKLGLAFVGQSGKLLRETLGKHKIVDFCLVNAVRCRPPQNRLPSSREIQCCKHFLDIDIASMPNLQLIVPLGNVALASLLGQKYRTITKHSGKLLEVDGRKYLPVFHPAYILRNRNELKTFEEHIGRIPMALTGSLIDSSDFGTYTVVRTYEEWESLVNSIIDKGYFVYDLETTGLSPFKGSEIRCIGFSYETYQGAVLPFPVVDDRVQRDLKVLFSSKRIGKVGHNVKFDNLFVRVLLGYEVNNTIWDTKYSQFLLNENESNDLKDMAWKYSRIGGYEKLLGAEPQVADEALLYTYCATDVDLTHRIYRNHVVNLPKEQHYVLTNLMLPVTDVLVAAEIRGMQLDPTKLDDCEKEVDKKIADLSKAIKNEKSVQDYENANGEFNPNSYLQLGEILFKYEGLTPVSKTKKTKRPSTDRASLEVLANESTLCKHLVEYSLYNSLKTKMIKELREHGANNRIHTFYSLTRTSTGRTASRNPNLQNVTKGNKDLVGIRKVFCADQGFVLAEFDLNQHELRCMAEIAGDKNLADAILSSDVHRSTAASILGIPKDAVTDDQRRNIGKTFNFGLIYGLTEHGIMRRLKCDELTAKMYIDRFFSAYAKTNAWMKQTAEFARKNGYVQSITGRVRHFPIWDELDDKSVREAINMPIQALASDILLYGLIAVHRLLRDKQSYISLEVHDSIVCNIHESELDLIPVIQKTMADACKKHIRFVLPLEVDVKVGPNWGELHDSSDEQKADEVRVLSGMPNEEDWDMVDDAA